jgi:hypothetical protein
MASLEKPLLIFLRNSLALGLTGLPRPELSLEESSLAPAFLGVGIGVDVGVGAALLFETGVVAPGVSNLTDRGVVDELDLSSSVDFFDRLTCFSWMRGDFANTRRVRGGVCVSIGTADTSTATGLFSVDFCACTRRGESDVFSELA